MRPPRIINNQKGPEAIIQDDIIKYLRYRDWMVKETHGNMYSNGWPDLFAAHTRYGCRWIEVKNPKSYAFTPAQLEFFPLFNAHGVGIWILTAATDSEYEKLWGPQNWYVYLSLTNQRSANHLGSVVTEQGAVAPTKIIAPDHSQYKSKIG